MGNLEIKKIYIYIYIDVKTDKDGYVKSVIYLYVCIYIYIFFFFCKKKWINNKQKLCGEWRGDEVAQQELSSNKCHASAFSNIKI